MKLFTALQVFQKVKEIHLEEINATPKEVEQQMYKGLDGYQTGICTMISWVVQRHIRDDNIRIVGAYNRYLAGGQLIQRCELILKMYHPDLSLSTLGSPYWWPRNKENLNRLIVINKIITKLEKKTITKLKH